MSDVSALHVRVAVNCGDHAQDMLNVVEIAPDETVIDFAQRILGDIGHHRSLDRFEDRIEIRLVKPVSPELPSGPVIF